MVCDSLLKKASCASRCELTAGLTDGGNGYMGILGEFENAPKRLAEAAQQRLPVRVAIAEDRLEVTHYALL
jgi:hypothetical protein